MKTDAERLLADISDDWYALWEVEQVLSKLAPGRDDLSRRQLVQRLVEQELLHLVTGEDWNSLRVGSPLPTDEALQVVALPDTWRMPRPTDRIYAVVVSKRH